MSTKYHLKSAEELSMDILDSIKAAYKSKPITIIVEEDTSDFQLTNEMKAGLDERLNEDQSTYLSERESIKQLVNKYGL